ncbi:MAG TPA: hypothetical protein VFW52_00265 [Candidatus Saccharimonadales bacterium]|nr:hypothetical protein [Candidatus Saccharimonadales bacterium]
MTESVGQILGSKQFTPPDEVSLIKDYVKRRYKSGCSVKLQRGALVVSVPSSALAATLHLERQKLIKACNLGDKKLFIRNGK